MIHCLPPKTPRATAPPSSKLEKGMRSSWVLSLCKRRESQRVRSFREYRLTLMIYKISSDSFRTSAHFRGSPCRRWSRTCQLAQIFSLSQRENSTEGFVARSAPAALFWAFASSLVITACHLTFALSKGKIEKGLRPEWIP